MLNHWLFPPEFIDNISVVKNKYLNYEVEILLEDTHILVKANEVTFVQINSKDEKFVKFTSFEQNKAEDDNSYNYHLEFEASKMKAPVTDYRETERRCIQS